MKSSLKCYESSVKRMMVMFVFAISCGMMFAQDAQKKSFFDNFYAELRTGATTKQHNTLQHIWLGSIGYKFNNSLYGFIRTEFIRGIYEKGDDRTHFKSNIGGLGVGCKVLSLPELSGSLDLQGMIGTNLYDSEMKATVYEMGVVCKIRKGFTPILGISYRHTNSRTDGIPHFNNVFFSIGMTL